VIQLVPGEKQSDRVAVDAVRAPAVVAAGGFGTVADLGGGRGILVAAILAAHPGLRHPARPAAGAGGGGGRAAGPAGPRIGAS
jgi:hypothetical protein